MIDASGFITAGGRSSRMGRDKAWLELGGLKMIERVVRALAPVTSSLTIIANSERYACLGLPVVRDSHTDVGPLEAIRTALACSSTPRVALAGCDLPFLTSELFAFLLGVEGDYQAVVPVAADDRLQPLAAIYSTSALAAVTDLILSGERKVSRLFDRVPTRLVTAKELSHLCGFELFFENVNTPGEYARARRFFDEAGGP
jgi:molybdopterin-guanine dinucleotide biosynthesis protein A